MIFTFNDTGFNCPTPVLRSPPKVNISLKSLVNKLKNLDSAMLCELEDGRSVGYPHNYTGNLEDLALEPVALVRTVGEFFEDMLDILDGTDTYVSADPEANVWVSRNGEKSGLALIGIALRRGKLILITRE